MLIKCSYRFFLVGTELVSVVLSVIREYHFTWEFQFPPPKQHNLAVTMF